MLKSRYKCDVGYSGHESSLLKTINWLNDKLLNEKLLNDAKL
jgi:hypothetical protein